MGNTQAENDSGKLTESQRVMGKNHSEKQYREDCEDNKNSERSQS